MAIISTDIKYKYSFKDTLSNAGNTYAGTAGTSLGRKMCATEITSASLNNLFDDVTGDENLADNDDYRCIFVHNAHGSLTWQAPKVWIISEVAGGATATIAIDDTLQTIASSTTTQALEIATVDTVPGGAIAFTGPVTKLTGLDLLDLTNGYCRAIWFKRLAAHTAALNNDGVGIRVEGDTAA